MRADRPKTAAPRPDGRHAGVGPLLAALVAALVGLSQTAAAVVPDGVRPAFPGATGYGATATGWIGGHIVLVSSLADAGPGSLRACAEGTEAPRVCVFAVAGTVLLESPIFVGSNIYIAGQTAPGEGVQLRLAGGSHTPLIVKDATDVVIRHLKLRPGPSPHPSATVDAVTLENARRVYLGNLSMAFATDETFNIHVSGATAADITLADSILALSLDRSNHPKGRHSKGALICSDEGVGNSCGRISLIGNLFAHHRDRMPDVKGTAIGPVEIVNNVFFNPISQFGEFYDLLGDAVVHYHGNVALAGPSTNFRVPEAVQVFEWSDDATLSLHATDNIAGVAEGCRPRPVALFDRAARDALEPAPSMPSLAPDPASTVLERVLDRAGDRIPGRRALDALDRRVIEDVRTCSGRVIDAPQDVGGWPVPDPGNQTSDAAEWAEPDRHARAWEINPNTGISHLETWLARQAGDLPEAAP